MFIGELEKIKQEKESSQLKIENFDNASKSLYKLIGSQIPYKIRKGLGFVSYNDIPPPSIGLFSPPNLDLSNSGLKEFQQLEFEGYGPKTSKSISEDISNEVRESPNAPLVKELVSDDKLEKKTVFPIVAKIEFAHCNYHIRERVVSGNNYTRVNYHYSAKKAHPSAHKNIVPRAILMKIGLRPLNTARPVNIAHPKTIVYSARPMSHFYKLAQSTVKRHCQTKTALTNKNYSQKVNTAKGKFYTARPKVVNTARPNSTVVNVVRASQVNSLKASACWVWRPTKLNSASITLKKHNYVDARGRSKHMTGNMSYLLDFKEFDGGYVTFRGGAKIGKITSKGTLKTADESQVLLKVPRKNNMYNVNMKNIVPKESLTCLVTKATLDESMIWHKRLGYVNFKTINKLVKENLVRGLPTKCFENNQTCVACLKGKQHKASSSKDETSGILKSIITEIENLVDKKVKIIRCDNGTEFKNRVMSDRPTWLFDIDVLTKLMNYVPVVAGTNYNDFIGTEESIGACHSSKETRSSQDCILMPLWKDGLLFNSSSKNSSNNEPQPSSDARKKDDGVRKESGIDNQERPKNSTQDINTVGPSINTASTNITTGSLNINIVSPTVTTARSNGSQTEPCMFSLGDNATFEATHADFFSDETEVDMSNITTTYLVPSTPNTRIHKDHSLNHVIGDVQSSVQTMRMTKISNEQGFISVVYERKTHEDLHTCLFACFLSQVEPKKVIQDLTDPSWIEAMQDELLQFKLQKGYTQEEGIDYDEVFAPVARIEAIRLFLAYSSFKDFVVYQMDVKSAFLYGKIEEEVYVYQPLGVEDPKFPDRVYKMSYMGELTFFLGLQVSQKDDGIFISQDKYVDEILKKFGFSTVKTTSTPMETSKPLLKDAEAGDVDVHLYRSMIGSLMYLTALRPNIMFDVCACARFQVTPKVSHLYAVKRIFRYLKGQPKLGLWYPKDSPFDLEAYTDNDYAGVSLDRKSTTGGCQFLGSRLISWQYKKQTIVANSTTEAEYVAAASCYGQSSRPIPLVANETVIKEWEDRMERAATIASSLEFWQTATVSTLDNEEMEITATIDGKVKIVTESSIRRHLKLEDSDGISNLPTTEIFKQLALMGAQLFRVKDQQSQLSPITHPPTNVADEAASTGVDIRHGGAATTVTSLDAGKGQCDKGRMQHNELMDLVTKLSDRVVALETDLQQTKNVCGTAFTKLIKKVKKLEKTVKTRQARRKARIVVSDDEEVLEDPSKQGRKIAKIDQDPDISLVQHDAEPVSTTGALVSTASASSAKYKGKAIMDEAKTIQTKTKLQLEQERLGYEEALRFQAEIDEEERQRITRVLEEASSFNIKEWDDIQARVEADEEAEERRNKPLRQARQRTYMSQYIKNMGSHTLKQLKSYSFDEIKNLFKTIVRRVHIFVPMESESERVIPELAAGSSKIDAEEKLDKEEEELSQERIQQMMIIVPEQGMNVEALQTKYPIIDWEIYTEGAKKEDLVKLWSLVKEKFTSTEPTEDKEREIWVVLKRLFEPDTDDELWKLKKHIHDITWRLYNTCGVHHVSTKDEINIYMLVEREYPLSRGVLTHMLVAKLLVEQDNEMSREFLRKIFMQVERPRR
ncbi:putative ribonuclease H-like domain-containing protein [Tanacetum coccineum]